MLGLVSSEGGGGLDGAKGGAVSPVAIVDHAVALEASQKTVAPMTLWVNVVETGGPRKIGLDRLRERAVPGQLDVDGTSRPRTTGIKQKTVG